MEALIEFAKILLPAGAVLYAMFLTVRLFLRKEIAKQQLDIKNKNTAIVLPIRLQAYERICLFLERISPKNLVPRVNTGDLSVAGLHHTLISEIREEFNHNLSQQVYMSADSWEMVKSAMEQLVMIINEAAGELDGEVPAIELARKVFEKILTQEHLNIDLALSQIKDEIQQVF